MTEVQTHFKSRKGCAECKRKRVKCDEAKPVCGRCRRHPELCDYGLKLSWTQGRPFKKKARTATGAYGVFDAAPAEPNEQLPRSTAEVSDTTELGKDTAFSFVPEHSALQDTTGDELAGGPALGSSSYNLGTPPCEDTLIAHNPYEDDVEEIVNINYLPQESAVARFDFNQPRLSPSLSTYSLLCPLESPNAYFFLHHYTIHTSATLFPLIPPAARGDLLSIAASKPHLLSALLAISCDHYSRLRGDSSPELKNRAMFFSRKAIAGLREAMNDPNEACQFSTISTVLALCTNDIMEGGLTAWKAHLRGAEQLLSLAVGKSKESTAVTDPAKLFLIKWFAALDLFAGISSLEKSLISDGRYWSIGSSADGSAQYIDDFVGFSLELMPILSRIGRMARLQQRRKHLGSSLGLDYAEMAEDLDSLLSDNVAHTEQQLNALFERVSSPSIIDAFPAILAGEAILIHQLFVYAALLHLYRRVQELPKDHPKPEHAMSRIVEIIELLRPESPAVILILWPLFSAGCETDDPVRRQIIMGRMLDMRMHGMGNVSKAVEVMQRYWEAGTDERWDVFLGRHGIDLVLF
ncbi:hypothetical protein MBLNU459_g0749t1 [Dothideomycetes sp. NU459]